MRSVVPICAISIWLAMVSYPLANELTDAQEERIKELAIEAILEQPEVIEEAIKRLRTIQQERQSSLIRKSIEDRSADLTNDDNAPILGNPQGDAIVVEFFDYNCPYCKRALPIVEQLIALDKDVKLVFREFPILSDGSRFAARAALASRNQGKYEEMHKALMDVKGRVDEANTIEVAKKLGLDIERLRADMMAPEVDQHIELSMELAQALGINGTPSFVIGDEVAPGLIQLDRMKTMVEKARSLTR